MGDNTPTIQSSEVKLISQLFDNQPDAVVWFTPKFSEGNTLNPVDFEVGYCNRSLCNILKVTPHELTGASLLFSPVIDDVTRKHIWEQCLLVWETGKHHEFTYFSPFIQRHLNVQRSKLQNGVMSITRDHTKFIKDFEEKQQQAKLISQIIESSTSGVSLYESIRNKAGQIVDFKLKLANQKSAELTGFTLEEIYKYTAKELMVIRGNPNFFEVLKKVAETGAPVYLEHYSQIRDQWLAFSIKKFEDGYLLNYIDITHTKSLEKKAKDQAEMLGGILNASVTGLLTLEAIYSSSGKIEDFNLVLLNAAAEKLLGLKEEDRNKTYLTLFPNAKKNGFFDLYESALLTGTAISKEFFYKDDGYNGWYYISVSKMNDNTLVQSFSDITQTRENKS
jgi:PAS domain-containing protein